ncbi:type IV toxin-antitoxin system AbiEi family antitoxin domain-containing protein [Chromobacterium haemolyticum]|uniref:type IV toxin-antitoxin system AbiEi family antitoxin domain-containing protein n=1 Tax=Chromobacterium haemolyticum TaxID=394935 RepID=UPI00069508DB|nr:type IV toxin-antitoxin system AbiEi family antitoxin domain-containing protein [Chromobacterium haemolyticum]
MSKPLALLEPAQIAMVVQRLMREAPRSQPMDSRLLRDLGVSVPLALQLVKLGWLYRLSVGAYLLTGDAPSPEGTIAYLSRRISGLHVGGKTALDWQGVRHNVMFRERLVLWGQAHYPFPAWIRNVTLYDYQTTRLFDDGVPYGKWLKPVPGRHPDVMVSLPERALVELVSQLGRGQSLEEVRNLMLTMRNLRRTILDEMLEHCTKVTVVRMVCKLRRESGYDWARGL